MPSPPPDPAPGRDSSEVLRFAAAPDVPLPYRAYGDHLVVLGTADVPPIAEGATVDVELPGERVTVTARTARGGERDKLRRWWTADPVLGARLRDAEHADGPALADPGHAADGGPPFLVLSRTDTYDNKRRLNVEIIAEFREHGGVVTRSFRDFSFAGVPLLLLHHRGRHSGRELVNPLQYRPHGDGWIVVATNGGSPWHPHWYRNLRAEPRTVVEIGTADGGVATVPVVARDLVGAERENLLYGGRAAERLSRRERFGGYQAFIDREVPVVHLGRSAPGPDGPRPSSHP